MGNDPRQWRDRLTSAVPALLLPGVLFVVLPLQLYLPNRTEIGSDVLSPMALLALAGVGAVIALAAIPSATWRNGIARGFFFGGLFLLLGDALAPTTLPILDGQGTDLPIAEPLSPTLVEVALLAVCVAGALWTPTRIVRAAGAILVVVSCGWELAHLAATGVFEARKLETVAGDEGGGAASPRRPNVYHLVLDGFSSDGFEGILDELDLRAAFDGFVYFPRNQSNHTLTNFSFPSFLTSRLIQAEGFQRWSEAARTGSEGLLRDVREAGYTTWGYGDAGHCDFRPDHCVTSRDVELPWQRRARVAHFFDLWLLRVVPNFLQAETYAHGRGLFSQRLEARGSRPTGEHAHALRILGLLERLSADADRLPASNQYVYAHLLLPHLPFVLDGRCGYHGASPGFREGIEIPTRLYLEQASCVTRQLAGFLDRLRSLRRYRDSIVVLHADHGNLTPCSDTRDRLVTAEASRAMQAVSLNGRSGTALDCWSRALLLVKPAGAEPGTGLDRSERHTQLLDLRPTVRALVGLPKIPALGADVLGREFPAAREVELLAGGYRPLDLRDLPRGARGFGTLCVDIPEGELNHFIYAPSRGGWRVLPNLRVRC